jgi:hypothetical protein
MFVASFRTRLKVQKDNLVNVSRVSLFEISHVTTARYITSAVTPNRPLLQIAAQSPLTLRSICSCKQCVTWGSHCGRDDMLFFWALTPCRLVGKHQQSLRTYCLHLRSWKWRRYVSRKLWYLPMSLHGVKPRKNRQGEIWKFRPYPKENITRLTYRNQNNRCSFWEPYEIHAYFLWAKCRINYIKANGVCLYSWIGCVRSRQNECQWDFRFSRRRVWILLEYSVV